MRPLIIFPTAPAAAAAAECMDSLYITRSFSVDSTTSLSQSTIIIIGLPVSAASSAASVTHWPSNNQISPQHRRPTSNCDWSPTRWRPASRDPAAIGLAVSEDRTLEASANWIWLDSATSVAAYVTSSYASMTYSASEATTSLHLTLFVTTIAGQACAGELQLASNINPPYHYALKLAPFYTNQKSTSYTCSLQGLYWNISFKSLLARLHLCSYSTISLRL